MESDLNEHEMQQAIKTIDARLTVVENDFIEIQQMSEALHEAVEILRDIKGSIKVLSFIADTSKKMIQVGLIFVPAYLFWDEIKALWDNHHSGTP